MARGGDLSGVPDLPDDLLGVSVVRRGPALVGDRVLHRGDSAVPVWLANRADHPSGHDPRVVTVAEGSVRFDRRPVLGVDRVQRGRLPRDLGGSSDQLGQPNRCQRCLSIS
uniref:(northern house mosquito) hypothetical protein n=1 Tax=Culex pipiens TaxID=7175 RepID=A0A8D8P4A3_CULPI